MEYIDKELGRVVFRKNSRAKRYIFRSAPGGIIVTMPSYVSLQDALQTLEKFRPQLLTKKITRDEPLLDENTQLQTRTFSLNIFRSDRANFYFSLKDNVLHVACPKDTDFSVPEIQRLLRKNIERFLRLEATLVLPKCLEILANKFGFTYKQVKINGSKGRWGSCSNLKIINLSFYLMLLPEYLADYVLLHELTHTLEMNHSTRFWQRLDAVTNNQSAQLRNELKKHKTSI